MASSSRRITQGVWMSVDCGRALASLRGLRLHVTSLSLLLLLLLVLLLTIFSKLANVWRLKKILAKFTHVRLTSLLLIIAIVHDGWVCHLLSHLSLVWMLSSILLMELLNTLVRDLIRGLVSRMLVVAILDSILLVLVRHEVLHLELWLDRLLLIAALSLSIHVGIIRLLLLRVHRDALMLWLLVLLFLLLALSLVLELHLRLLIWRGRGKDFHRDVLSGSVSHKGPVLGNLVPDLAGHVSEIARLL